MVLTNYGKNHSTKRKESKSTLKLQTLQEKHIYLGDKLKSSRAKLFLLVGPQENSYKKFLNKGKSLEPTLEQKNT